MIQLLSHQQKALDETKNFNRVAYYLDMGLGKTFVGSEKLKSFGTKQNLLICQKSKVNDWIEHNKIDILSARRNQIIDESRKWLDD